MTRLLTDEEFLGVQDEELLSDEEFLGVAPAAPPPAAPPPAAPRLTPAEAGKRATETFKVSVEQHLPLHEANDVVQRESAENAAQGIDWTMFFKSALVNVPSVIKATGAAAVIYGETEPPAYTVQAEYDPRLAEVPPEQVKTPTMGERIKGQQTATHRETGETLHLHIDRGTEGTGALVARWYSHKPEGAYKKPGPQEFAQTLAWGWDEGLSQYARAAGRAARFAGRKAEAIVPESWRSDVQTAMAGPLFEWSPAAANAWMANIGHQAPVLAEMWVAQALTGPGGGYISMTLLEAGTFYDGGQAIGLDDDIAKKYAKIYGPISGAIEYAQNLWMLKAFGGRAAKPLTGPAKQFVMRVLKEVGGIAWEGAEELSQTVLENYLLQKAVEEHNARYPEQPPLSAPELGEGGLHAFAIGAVTAGTYRGAGHVSSYAKGRLSAQVAEAEAAPKVAPPITPAPAAEVAPIVAPVEPAPPAVPVAAPAVPPVAAEPIAPIVPPAEKVAPVVEVAPEVAPPIEPGALPEPAKPRRGPMVRAMPTAERQQLAERLELAASEAAGQDLDAKELRTRFTQAVQEVVPKAQQGAALALTEQISGERSFLRALSKAEKLVVKTYGAGEEKMVSEPEALRGRLRGERVAAQAAWKAASEVAREKAKALKVATKEEARAAKTAIKEIRAELVDAVREALPVSERGRLITQIRDAETPKALEKALARVDKVVEQHGQRMAKGRLVKLLGKAKEAKLRKQYKPVVEKILAGYNITKPSDSTLGKLADLAHYLAQHPDDHFLTPREIAALGKITARNVRDMTAEELDAVSDAITQILHANRTTNRILAGQQRGRISKSAEQLRKALKQPLKGYGPHELTPAESRGVFRRVLDWVKRVITPPRYRATLADQQSRDPGQKGGPLAEILERPIAWGASDVLAYEQEAEDVLFAAMRTEGIDPHSQETVRQLQEVPVAITLASGDTMELSNDGLMSFYANTGDLENRRALVRDGWNPEYVFHRKTPGGKPALVRAVRVQPLPLTAEDVLAIRALLPESYRRIVDAAQTHKNGPLVEAAWDAIQTVKGYAPETLPDHWHLRRNRAAQVRDAGELQRLWYDAALEDSGITKDRSPGANQPVITGHFTEELTRQTGILSRIAGLAVPIRDARMFLGNPMVRETLDSNLGVDYARGWETLLRSVADVAPAEAEPFTPWVKKQTGRFMAAKLSLNIISGAKTVGSIAPAAHYVGWSYMFNALLDGPSAIGEALARARIYSPSIRDRYERSMRELQSPGYTQGVARLGPTPWVEQGMIFIRSGDQTVVGTVWLGAEKRIAAENPGLRESNPEAYYELVRRFTEDVVNWTQPFAGAAIQPPIGLEAKKNPWIHWTLTMFKSQAIQNTTMALDAADRFARSPKGKEDYKRLLSSYVSLAIGAAWYFAWTQFARQLYKPLREKLLGEERAEKEDKISTIFNALRATAGNVVFIDPLLDAAESVARELSGLSGIGGAETPLAQIAENMNRSAVELGKAIQDGYDGEWKKSKDHVVKGTLRAARVLADVTGMPDVVPRYLGLLYDYAAVEEEAGPPKPPKPPEPRKPPK